jgi:hypothetical protein
MTSMASKELSDAVVEMCSKAAVVVGRELSEYERRDAIWLLKSGMDYLVMRGLQVPPSVNDVYHRLKKEANR